MHKTCVFEPISGVKKPKNDIAIAKTWGKTAARNTAAVKKEQK